MAEKQKGKPAKKRQTRKTKESHGTCFVVMPFGGFYDTYYDLIFAPAVAAADLECVRGDSIFRPGQIMSDVWVSIQNATVLLADMTTKNPNVLYEMGLAHAIGKPIVLVSETLEDVPFDLRAYRVLLYNKDVPDWGSDLQKRIITALQETLENPVEAVPEMFREIVPTQAPEQGELYARIERLEREVRRLVAEPSYEGLTSILTDYSRSGSLESVPGITLLQHTPAPPGGLFALGDDLARQNLEVPEEDDS